MTSAYPLTGYHFQVDFLLSKLNKPVNAQFAEIVGGFSTSISYGEKNEGPATLSYSDLVLKRGVVTDDSLLEWFNSHRQSYRLPIPVLVSVLDGTGGAFKRWCFFNAYPVKWSTSGFNASQAQVLYEEITLRYESYRIVTTA
jgi:phage tail-like protein